MHPFRCPKSSLEPSRTISLSYNEIGLVGPIVFHLFFKPIFATSDLILLRKIKLQVEDVQGYNCLTNFHGMDMTRDKLCSLIKKWQSIIEASVDVRTTDGYLVRLFCIAFTKKMPNQLKKACYATMAQQKAIRAKMMQVMSEEGGKCDLKELVKKLLPEVMGQDIEKQCQGIFPVKDCFIRKVKVLKKPKFDLLKLMEMHGDNGEDVGANVAPIVEEVKVAGAGGRY